jgi:hypothetical protein
VPGHSEDHLGLSREKVYLKNSAEYPAVEASIDGEHKGASAGDGGQSRSHDGIHLGGDSGAEHLSDQLVTADDIPADGAGISEISRPIQSVLE